LPGKGYNLTPPRLLFLRLSRDNPGGSENQICHLAQGLKNSGLLEPLLVTDREGFLTDKFRGYGILAYIFPNLNKFQHLMATYYRLSRVVKENNVKTVQAHTFREDILLRGFKLFSPGIKHIYRPHTHIENSHIPLWKMRLYHKIDYLTQGYVDRYVCIANCIREELITKSGVAREKIQVVNDGVPGFRDVRENLPSIDKPLRRRVAIVARLAPGKGHDSLFKAISLLKSKGISIDVRVIGGGAVEFTNELKEMVRCLSIEELVEFYGYTQDIPNALAGISVVVLPSRSEVLPNAILEAWSLRKIVVASDVGGIPEMIIDKENGYLHPPNDEHELAEILEMIFTAPAYTWNSIRLAGEKTWRLKFSVESVVKKFIDFYCEIGAISQC